MSSHGIPEEPLVAPEQRARGRLSLRYEDVSQNGHLMVEALPTALGEVWRHIGKTAAISFTRGGAIPILSRVVVSVGEGPISVHAPAEVEGLYQLSHAIGADGAIDKILLGMWVRVLAPIGRTYPPEPEGAGRPIVAGSVYAEHVFTRLFAPTADRKVRALAREDGSLYVPEARWEWRDPESLLASPDGATALDDHPVPDEAVTNFGLDHTDSNQHVNSLVYPRLFIEAALRRFAALGRAAPPRQARALEIAYRKPCFAGERARVSARAFEVGSRLGVVAALLGEGESRPRCTARVVFGE